MWGKTNEPKPPLSSPEPHAPAAPAPFERPAATPTTAQQSTKTFLGHGLALKGELSGREEVTIDGQFEGQIRVSGARVTIGASGRVAAEVEADEIVVEGRADGNLRARERVVVRSSGSVHGEIETKRLAIEEGAVIRGRITMAMPGEALPARTTSERRAANPEMHRAAVAASETVS